MNKSRTAITSLIITGLAIGSLGIGMQYKCKIDVSDLYNNQAYQSINEEVIIINEKDLEKKTTPLTVESSEGGEMITFYENDELVKITSSYFGEMGNSVHEFYFNENGLIQAKQKTIEYDMPMYMDDFKEIGTTEDVFYIKDDSVIKWTSDGVKKVKCDDEYKEKESEIFKEKDILLEQL